MRAESEPRTEPNHTHEPWTANQVSASAEQTLHTCPTAIQLGRLPGHHHRLVDSQVIEAQAEGNSTEELYSRVPGAQQLSQHDDPCLGSNAGLLIVERHRESMPLADGSIADGSKGAKAVPTLAAVPDRR